MASAVRNFPSIDVNMGLSTNRNFKVILRHEHPATSWVRKSTGVTALRSKVWVKEGGAEHSTQIPVAHVGSHHIIKECKHGKFILNHLAYWVSRSLKMYGEWSELELEEFFWTYCRTGMWKVESLPTSVGSLFPWRKRLGGMESYTHSSPKIFCAAEMEQDPECQRCTERVPKRVHDVHGIGDVGTTKVPNIVYHSPGTLVP